MTRVLAAAGAAVVVLVTLACSGSSPTSPSSLPTSRVNLAGPHRLTIQPSTVCTTWPATAAGPLSWDVDVTVDATGRWVANAPGILESRIFGAVNGNQVSLTAHIFTVTDTCWLTIHGSAETLASGSRVSAPLDGTLEAECDNLRLAQCSATNHTVTLEPR